MSPSLAEWVDLAHEGEPSGRLHRVAAACSKILRTQHRYQPPKPNLSLERWSELSGGTPPPELDITVRLRPDQRPVVTPQPPEIPELPRLPKRRPRPRSKARPKQSSPLPVQPVLIVPRLRRAPK